MEDTESGFTLVEIVVSMVLLAVLAVTTLPLMIRTLDATSTSGSATTGTNRISQVIEQARTNPTCSNLSSLATTSTFTDGHQQNLTLAVTLPDGCTAGTAAKLVATVTTTTGGAQLSTATTMIFVAS